MRLTLLLILFVLSFQARSYCFSMNASSAATQSVTIDLDEAILNGFIDTNNISFNFNPNVSFTCISGTQSLNASVEDAQKPNQVFKVRSEDGLHFVFVSVYLSISSAKNSFAIPLWSSLPADKINSSGVTYKVTYKLLNSYNGAVTEAKINTQKEMSESIGFREGIFSSGYMKQKVNLIFKFTNTTCRFSDQVVSLAPISLKDVQNDIFKNPISELPSFICNFKLGFSTSDIKYKFVSDLAQGNVLINESDKDSGGAGNVGFRIAVDNKEVELNNNLFILSSRGSLMTNDRVLLPLKFKYSPYGDGKYTSGTVLSRVKIITSYD